MVSFEYANPNTGVNDNHFNTLKEEVDKYIVMTISTLVKECNIEIEDKDIVFDRAIDILVQLVYQSAIDKHNKEIKERFTTIIGKSTNVLRELIYGESKEK